MVTYESFAMAGFVISVILLIIVIVLIVFLAILYQNGNIQSIQKIKMEDNNIVFDVGKPGDPVYFAVTNKGAGYISDNKLVISIPFNDKKDIADDGEEKTEQIKEPQNQSENIKEDKTDEDHSIIEN